MSKRVIVFGTASEQALVQTIEELRRENAALREIIAEARPYILACGMVGSPKLYTRMLLARPRKEEQP